MRQIKRKVTDIVEIEKIIKECRVCRIAMCDDGKPYVVPMNFGYTLTDGMLAIYIHCAHEGRKAEIFQKNPDVCVEMDTEIEYKTDYDTACKNTCYFASVIANGKIEKVTGRAEKEAGLDILLNCIIGAPPKGSHNYKTLMVDRTAVYKIVSRDFTAKKYLPTP
jgi:Predicted flavin-nucleotide-binding protein